jgi:hypothetical protein
MSGLDRNPIESTDWTGSSPSPPSSGIGVYWQNIIDPTSGQIVSKGGRTSAIATAIQVVTTTTTATFYWDGSNGSQPFKTYRDDATVFGPFITGSDLICSASQQARHITSIPTTMRR